MIKSSEDFFDFEDGVVTVKLKNGDEYVNKNIVTNSNDDIIAFEHEGKVRIIHMNEVAYVDMYASDDIE